MIRRTRGIKSGDSGKGVSLNSDFPMTVDAKTKQGGNKEGMLPTISTTAKLLLNAALDLKLFCADDCAPIGNSRPIRIYEIRVLSTLRLSGEILLRSNRLS